ncbi:hypothetical protein CANCADRAFT_4061 [Tortispora caseinolytica NRRL Y-17796]|uniref:Zn(2)-C6 fungal-type domain-containing protein n=1 Tax=Tortispora caseinolytica NRRL Y-17796 TaxID=767744 RepID=A0A1E4TCE9_9ASCO|nr:hypothetical protein CANCADRAFT_4061 [Tortispora caseinolytica NRRL Y-17796]
MSYEPEYLRNKSKQACEQCRAAKVRCIQSASSNDKDPCDRCIKLRQNCIYEEHRRSRTKKHKSHEVVTLLQEINDLKQQLRAKDGLVSSNSSESLDALAAMPITPASESAPPTFISGIISSFSKPDDSRQFPVEDKLQDIPEELLQEQAARLTGYVRRNRAFFEAVNRWDVLSYRNSKLHSLLTENLISESGAYKSLELYKKQHYAAVPFVRLNHLSFEEMRSHFPLTLDAVILAVERFVSPEDGAAAQKLVCDNYGQLLAVEGEKNLDLLQALMITSTWYTFPEFHNRLRFHTYTAAARVISDSLMLPSTKCVNFLLVPSSLAQFESDHAGSSRSSDTNSNGLGSFDSPSGSAVDETPSTSFNQKKIPAHHVSSDMTHSVKRLHLSVYAMNVILALPFQHSVCCQWSASLAESYDFINARKHLTHDDKALLEFVDIAKCAEQILHTMQCSKHKTSVVMSFSEQYADAIVLCLAERLDQRKPVYNNSEVLFLTNLLVQLSSYKFCLTALSERLPEHPEEFATFVLYSRKFSQVFLRELNYLSELQPSVLARLPTLLLGHNFAMMSCFVSLKRMFYKKAPEIYSSFSALHADIDNALNQLRGTMNSLSDSDPRCFHLQKFAFLYHFMIDMSKLPDSYPESILEQVSSLFKVIKLQNSKIAKLASAHLDKSTGSSMTQHDTFASTQNDGTIPVQPLPEPTAVDYGFGNLNEHTLDWLLSDMDMFDFSSSEQLFGGQFPQSF